MAKRALKTKTLVDLVRHLAPCEDAMKWLSRNRNLSPQEAWDKCKDPVDADALAGRECFGALDLSTKIDITAFVLVFPPNDADPKWRILPRFFIPSEGAERRERRDRVPYVTWARQKHIDTTDGNVVDYDVVKAAVAEACVKYQVREIAYDPWSATQIALQLQSEGATMVEFGQGFRSMSEPTKELEKLVLAGAVAHGGHPVLRWMANNTSVETDPAGNLKPSKKKSTDRIDGIVATVMALGRAIVQESGTSVYQDRGILVL